MTVQAEGATTFAFTYCAALDDGPLYLAGVARELEDADVPHTIIWERIGGVWKRHQWKNRTYAMAAYPNAGAGTAVYLGFDGTLKVRNPNLGSSQEVLEGGDDAPSSLRTVSAIRVIGDQLVVVGMRRMVYVRGLAGSSWERLDHGTRLDRSEVELAGFYAVDGTAADHLYAVGIGGEVWNHTSTGWTQLDSPTESTHLAVRCLGDGRVVVGGERGSLWILSDGEWKEVAHPWRDEVFSCIETWGERCFIASDSGAVFELSTGDDLLLQPFEVPAMSAVSWMASTASMLWFVGRNGVRSLSAASWCDESPPSELLS